MKKRIVCVLLTLIMLVGMLPLSASAAGQATSERAITVLKQMQNYNKTCTQYGTEWRNGYGTICNEKGSDHSVHSISEATADKALRAKLKELEAAVNAAGFSLSQNQFDALVVLTYDVGTSWLNGNGVLKSAVKNGLTGNAFLNAIGQTSGYNSGATWNMTDEQRRWCRTLFLFISVFLQERFQLLTASYKPCMDSCFWDSKDSADFFCFVSFKIMKVYHAAIGGREFIDSG